ncbi:type II toxin-antitoxin system VapC family toxin [Cyclobacterium plantarum]|uniref:Type II toxin-antitoxin system VapC family toxin n=1 Tax=Cyclobacterium plantarum TaxID=2716263 RepID=A0ABX0HE26_9BACT|nr:type II toxin-antitoxin system VapC family toxin [Cyclobacterium plantarum]NHE58646.1 type II toxin-antitoxin system VapC family toxin [Cyclobacterium plantarum]
MKQRIYVDTSVVGGYFDEEFEEPTRQLFDRLERQEIIFVVSDLLDLELTFAPEKVKQLLHKFSPDKFERINLTQEAIDLANAYIAEKVVGKTSLEDCRHIALATINKVDVLASWNFKHIVNLERIKGYNSVNMREGHHILEIRSPKDLLRYEND